MSFHNILDTTVFIEGKIISVACKVPFHSPNKPQSKQKINVENHL